MRLSVVIPVHNDQVRLVLCLRALEAQTLSADDFEVIIVDNGSLEPIDVDIARNMRVIAEPQLGSYAARNRGIEDAAAPIIAFTDADCIPDPTWLSEGLTYLDKHPGVSSTGGHIEVFASDPSHRTPTEVYESMHGFRQDRYVANQQFAATANLFVRSTVFEAVGTFNAALRSGGDVEFGNRSIDAGYRMEYVSSVVARHPSRRTVRSFVNKMFRTMAGMRDLATIRGQAFPFSLKGTVKLLVPPIPTVVRALRNDHVGPPADRFKYAYAVFVIHYARIACRIALRLGARSPR